MLKYKLALIVPIYNEVGNIAPLVSEFIAQRTSGESACPHELILVNNGSEDDSDREIEASAANLPWIKVVTIKSNRGYGGGIQAGWSNASADCTHIGWMPADRQYSVADLQRVWDATLREPIALHKGIRKKRYDGAQTRWVSYVYSFLVRKILRTKAKDINGLPKIFPASLLKKLNFPLANSFHLDGQILLACDKIHLPIREHSVTFYARRAGVSSWSAKRIAVYKQTFRALLKYRNESENWFQPAQDRS